MLFLLPTAYIGSDLFMDFTGALVDKINGMPMYNFMCMLANPKGELMPVPIFETIVSNMTGNMVKSICTEFHDRYKERWGSRLGTNGTPVYLHVDMFKGFIQAFCSAFNDTDEYTYLTRLFHFLDKSKLSDDLPFPAIITWCYSHLMSAVAKRTPDFVASKNNTRENKQEYKILMMQCMRRIKRATSKQAIEYHLNIIHLILQMPMFDFNKQKQRLKYVQLLDMAPTNNDCKENDQVCCLSQCYDDARTLLDPKLCLTRNFACTFVLHNVRNVHFRTQCRE